MISMTMRRIIILASLCATAFALQDRTMEQRMEGTVQRSTDAPKPKEPSKADFKLAKTILGSAESEAAGFEAGPRSFLCYQTALGYMKMDRAAARELLLRCLTASQGIEGDDETKRQVQGYIAEELVQFGPETAEQIMPQLEGSAKARVRAQLIRDYTKSKEYDRAIALVNSVNSAESEGFPYGPVIELMQRLPEEKAGERTTLFSQALADYRRRESDQGRFSSEDMGSFVVRFSGDVPANLALEAIDELLKQAAPNKDTNPLQMVVSNGDKMASFNSTYQFRLFQVLPTLKKLDPERAETLLRDNQQIAALMGQYKNGMQSLNPAMTDTPAEEGAEPAHMSMRITNGQGGGNPSAQEAERIAGRKQVEEIVKDAESNPKQAVARALSLPNTQQNDLKSQALDGVAKALLKKSPSNAKSAIDEQTKSVDQLRPMQQQRYLTSAANYLIELDEKEAAEKVIAQGMKLAARLHEDDLNANDPNEAMRPYWPSAAMWRSFVVVAKKISPQVAWDATKDINDPEIQLFTRIWLANTLLNVPPGLTIVQEKRKSGQNNMMMMDNRS